MQNIPSNIIPWLVGFPVFSLFGWRALKNYQRLRNPLSGYFAVGALSMATAFFLWSVPLLFTDNQTVMQIISIVGDFFLYLALVSQAALVYYLTLRDKVPKVVFMGPIVAIAVAGYFSHVYGYLHNGVAIVDGNFEYKLPFFASIAQIILLANVFLVGVLLFSRLKEQNSKRSKSNLIGISILLMLSATAGALNIISAGKPNETIPIIASYAVAFIAFLLILLFARIVRPKAS